MLAGVDKLFTPIHDGIEQGTHEHNQVRAFFDDIGPGDRFDFAFVAFTNRHANAVDFAKAPPFIRDLVGYFGRVQRAVNLARERLHLDPDLLLADHLPQMAVLEEVGGESRHARHELQEASLRIGRAIGVLPYLDQACNCFFVKNGGEQNDPVGGISRHHVGIVFEGTSALRRDDAAFFLKDRLP